MSRIVITGGPGAGKTTLLAALQARGFAIVGDSARTIIQDRRRCGLTPRPGPYDFANDVLRMDIASYTQHAATAGAVFFDRCVLDALCMLDQVTPLSDVELGSWLSTYRYSPTVFILPPWEDIYANDAERDHSFAHAVAVHAIVREWYRRCGYRTSEVPRRSVAERCDFMLQSMPDGAA